MIGFRSGRHVQVAARAAPKSVWRPRRWQVIAIVFTLLIGMGTALALWMVTRDSAPDSFSVQTVGALDIGPLTTTGLFDPDLGPLAPGIPYQTCFFILADTTATSDSGTVRVDPGVISGAAAAELDFSLQVKSTAGGMPGYFDCDTGGVVWGPSIFDGKLDAFSGADFGLALPVSSLSHIAVRATIEVPAGADLEAISGQVASADFTFELAGG